MKQVVDTGLPPLKQPFSWAVKASGQMLFTAHGPVRPDGNIHTGAVEEQARLTFSNLRNAVQAAGGTMADVTQVLIYMTDVADMPAIDAVYREQFYDRIREDLERSLSVRRAYVSLRRRA